jgi:hypothetical protein
MREVAQRNLGQALERREGAKHETVGRHKTHQAFVVDRLVALFIDPYSVLCRALEFFSSLFEGLKSERRYPAGYVLDAHEVDRVRDASPRRDRQDMPVRDHACPVIARRAKQSQLHDVAGRLARIRRRPPMLNR